MASRLTRTVRGESRKGQKLKVGVSEKTVVTHRTRHRETNGDSLAMLTQNNSDRQLLYAFAFATWMNPLFQSEAAGFRCWMRP